MELVNLTPQETPLDDLDRQVLQQLKVGGPQTRSALLLEVDGARTTVYERLTKLIRNQRVTKYSLSNGKAGRPKVFFKLMTPI